jgi:hypothetical protein
VNAATSDVFYYRVCRDLFGTAHAITAGKRNGMPAIFIPPACHWHNHPAPDSFEWLDTLKYYVNLNDLERRTWHQVLSGLSISAIARNERVSRQAIYTRLLGTRDRGGMIEKNYWVLVWCVARDLYPRRDRRRSASGAQMTCAEPFVFADHTNAVCEPQHI